MIKATISFSIDERLLSITGPAVSPSDLDLKDVFDHFIDDGYSPNAFELSLIESIERRIKILDESLINIGGGNARRAEREQWRTLLLALRPDRE